MSSVSYRNFTGTGADNYQRYFVPAIATPVSGALIRAADLRRGERVLDVACGTGLIARLAAEEVGPTGSVTGIDVASDMIELARSTPAPVGADIGWDQGDAASLPYADGTFDVVLCQMGLMFIEDRPAAVAEMHRVLAVGGRVVLNTPGAIHPAFELMEKAIVDHISPDLAGFVRMVFSMHDPALLGALLGDAGFADVTAGGYTTKLDLPAPGDFLWQYINLTPMGPLVAAAPGEAQAAMEQQVVEGWHRFTVGSGRTAIEQAMALGSAVRT